MTNIPATEFKARCLELMDRVAERNETYVITKRGKPVAKLVPVERNPKDSIFGYLRASGSIEGDILGPVVLPHDWENLEEWDQLNGADKLRKKVSASKTRKHQRSRR